MSTKESTIAYEAGKFWVRREDKRFTVYRSTSTHSVADSSYHDTDDGLSIAIARCNYLAKRHAGR